MSVVRIPHTNKQLGYVVFMPHEFASALPLEPTTNAPIRTALNLLGGRWAEVAMTPDEIQFLVQARQSEVESKVFALRHYRRWTRQLDSVLRLLGRILDSESPDEYKAHAEQLYRDIINREDDEGGTP